MNKSFLPLAALLLAACQPYNPVIDLDSYTEVVTYSVNDATGEAYISENASIDITGDVYNSNYGLKLNNLILGEGIPPQSADLTNLVQYFQEKNPEDPSSEALYTFFRQEQQTANAGTLDLTSMRFGWLTTTYWMNFTANNGADTYTGWAMPKARTLYAVENYITTSSFGTVTESAILPGYKFILNVPDKTVTVKAFGVKYPQKADGEDAQDYTLTFANMEWRNIPVQFTATGFYIPPVDFDPYIDGEQSAQHHITGLTGEISANFEGRKRLSFKILNSHNFNANVVIEFDILNKPALD